MPHSGVTEEPSGAIERIERTGLIAVLRALGEREAGQVVDALVAAGVTVVEFTADTDGVSRLIRRENDRVGDRVVFGVGTVLDVATAEEAVRAGASFVVTPTVEPAVIEWCVTNEVPVVVGAYTPTEAVRATRAGADMVKIFPASTGGPAHVAAFQGPLDQLALVPTGGVTAETAGEYIECGATAVGVGSGLFPADALAEGRYDEIRERAELLLETVDR